jgi:integrase
MVREWIADSKVTGLGILRLPSGVETWYLRYREPGGKQQHHKIGRVGIVNRTLAREEAYKLLAAVARGEAPTSKRQELRSGPTVADLYQRLQATHYTKLRATTRASYESIWRTHLLPKLGKTKIQAVTSAHVMQLINGIAHTQANRTLAVLRKAFNLAILWGLRDTNPCAKVPGNSERKRQRYLSSEERVRLEAALDAIATSPLRWRFAQLIRLLLLTGCRVGEICRGRWEWVNEDAALLVIPIDAHKTGQSTGKDRVVHLPPAAIRILRELRRNSNTEWIIAGDNGGHLVGYQKLWEELLRMADIQGLLVHDLRRSYASIGLSVGVSLSQIGQLLGHTSPLTTARYAFLIDDAAKAAVARIGEAVATPQQRDQPCTPAFRPR